MHIASCLGLANGFACAWFVRDQHGRRETAPVHIGCGLLRFGTDGFVQEHWLDCATDLQQFWAAVINSEQ